MYSIICEVYLSIFAWTQQKSYQAIIRMGIHTSSFSVDLLSSSVATIVVWLSIDDLGASPMDVSVTAPE